MSKFADYAPSRPETAIRAETDIAEARPEDLAAIAVLTAEREGGVSAQYEDSIRAQLANSPQRCQLFIARLRSAPVAFARVGWLEADSIPSGWYLAGLIVADAYRRRGIGRALTEHRLRWLSNRTSVAYYFASLQNQPTIDLHAQLDFEELRRGVSVPNCSFHGGIGALYYRRLTGLGHAV